VQPALIIGSLHVMQPALIVGGLVVLIIIGFIWARISSARSDRRSMETYGRALGVLGDVSRRTGPSASVRVLPRAEVGKAHVRTEAGGAAAGAAAGGSTPGARSSEAQRGREPESFDSPPKAPPRVRAAGSAGISRPSASIPVPDGDLKFGDRTGDWAGASQRAFRDSRERAASRERRPIEPVQVPPERDPVGASAVFRRREETARPADPEVRPEPQVQAISADELRRQASVRRLWTAGLAGVALILVVIAAVQLSAAPPKRGASHPTTRSHHSTVTSSPTTQVTTTTAKPAVLTPESTANGWLTYRAPAHRYSLTFSAQGGDCWVGIETAPASGVFLWTGVVQPGVPKTYAAAGPVAVDFGAIGYISVTVNGIPARFPANSSTSGLAFTPG